MSFNFSEVKIDVLYNKPNVVLLKIESPNLVDSFEPTTDEIYRLYSYKSLVLEIVNGLENINAKTGLNYDGIRSVTTSKHITQAKNFILTGKI